MLSCAPAMTSLRARSAPRLAAALLAGLVAAAAARAEYDHEGDPPIARVASQEFEPPDLAEGPDWIRLGSAEWLKGDIEGMRDDKFAFDSDELDDLTLDFEDISAIVTTREHTLVFVGRIVVTGTLAMRGDVIRMRVGDELRSFDRADLMGIIAGTQRELNYWSVDVSAGVTARSGNTDQTETTGRLRITREDSFTRGNLSYNGSVGELDGATTVNNHRGTLKLDYFVGPRLYLIPVWLEVFKDEPQNLDWRFTPAAGIGYHVVDRSRLRWDVELGAGFQYVEYIEAPTGDTRFDSQAAGIIGTSWESDITSSLEFEGDYKLQVGLGNIRDTSHHLLTVLSQDLIWNLDLDVSFVWDRNESPLQESDGVRPDLNDFTTTVGLAWDF